MKKQSKPEVKKQPRRGRPDADIDLKALEAYCSLFATQQEIADLLGVCRRTIERKAREEPYKTIMERGYSKAKATLRRYQLDAAKAGNASILIWLGKNYLGQKDIVINQHEGKDGAKDVGVKLIIEG
jgi:DNA-binding XRE family transcriptional regulator